MSITGKLFELKCNIKYFFQRKFKGYSDVDYWNADMAIAKYAIPLIKYQKKTNRTPGGLTQKKWHNILDKIIYSLEHFADEEKWCHFNTQEEYEEAEKKIDAGMKLFAKWFAALWS